MLQYYELKVGLKLTRITSVNEDMSKTLGDLLVVKEWIWCGRRDSNPGHGRGRPASGGTAESFQARLRPHQNNIMNTLVLSFPTIYSLECC